MGPLHLLGFALVGLLGDVSAARPEPLDRIIAVVGEQPVFLSELRQRARPHMARLDAAVPNAAARPAAMAELQRDLLERMIDERFVAREADRVKVSVGNDEIDGGLRLISLQAKMSVPDLLVEVGKQGLTEAEYRAEIKRQVLEGKLFQLHVRARVKVTDAEALERERRRWLDELRRPVYVEVRL